MVQPRTRGPDHRPAFMTTRSSAILDLSATTPYEIAIFCLANHACRRPWIWSRRGRLRGLGELSWPARDSCNTRRNGRLGVVAKKVVHTLPGCEAFDAGVRSVEIVAVGPGFDGGSSVI